jgi:3',5'-cyclic AMP phosphodiesterase CpdA
MVNRGADWFFTLGDAQYEYGQYRDFRAVFNPAFKAVRSVTKAIAGNHEYYTKNARGHFRYWGRRAGTPRQPWRTFTPVKGWRVVMLDSNCEYVGGCGAKSPQGKWLRQVLASNTRTCTVAMWHHPLHSSGEYAGSADSMARARPLWHMSNQGGVDVVLNGHDHIYERFAKRSGMQQFTVGTGGKNHYDITTKAPGSRVRKGNRYGVLRLDLSSDGTYEHAFVTISGQVLDKGRVRCTNDPVT